MLHVIYRLSCTLSALTFLAASAVAQDDTTSPALPLPAVPDTEASREAVSDILKLVGDAAQPSGQRKLLLRETIAQPPTAAAAPQLQFAWLLLSMQEKSTRQSLAAAEQLANSNPQYLPGRVLFARLLLLANKRAQAIVELTTLAEMLNDPNLKASTAQQEHAARLLGLTVGYFAGPGKETIKGTTLAELTAATAQLPDALQIPFESARLAIEEEYRVLTEEGEQALKELRAGLEEEAAKLRDQLADARNKAASESEAARLQLQTNFSQLSTQWQNAWNTSQILDRQLQDLVRRQLVLSAQLNMIPPPRRDSQGRVDPADEQRYLAEVATLQGLLASVDYRLYSLGAQFDRVRRQGLLLERQMQYLQAQAQQLGMKLAMQNQSFNQLDAAIRAKEVAAAKAEPKKKSTSQLLRERAFSTYDDFNVYKEKKLLSEELSLP